MFSRACTVLWYARTMGCPCSPLAGQNKNPWKIRRGSYRWSKGRVHTNFTFDSLILLSFLGNQNITDC